MSAHRERRHSSLTLDQKVGSRASDRWWPVQQVVGKNQDGSFRTVESWIDMKSGGDGGEKSVAIDMDEGWNGAPPDLPSGDPGKQYAYQPASARYRQRFGLIDWTT